MSAFFAMIIVIAIQGIAAAYLIAPTAAVLSVQTGVQAVDQAVMMD